MNAIYLVFSLADSRYDEFIENKDVVKITKKTKEKVQFDVLDPKFHILHRKLKKDYADAKSAMEVTPDSYFVTLVSKFDCFISDLMRLIIQANPGVIDTNDKKLSYLELTELDSVEDARIYLVEMEIASAINELKGDRFDWLEKKVGFNKSKISHLLPAFVEVLERRNCIVHSNGLVSAQYIRRGKQVGFDLSGVKIGDELKITPNYFYKSADIIYQLAVITSQILWRKLLPQSLLDAEGIMTHITAELLMVERFELASKLLDFALAEKHANDEHEKTLIINKILSLQGLKKDKEASKLLSDTDWSNCKNKFNLATAVLKKEWDSAKAIMLRMRDEEEIEKEEYIEWPLFVDFRKTEQFLSAYKEIFSEDFSIPQESEVIDRDKLISRIKDKYLANFAKEKAATKKQKKTKMA